MKLKRLTSAALAATTLAGLAVGVTPASAGEMTPDRAARVFEVTVEITNLAPEGGTFQTPVWVGSHDGSFDLYDRGAPISPELERLAEDGNTGPLVEAFGDSGAGTDSVAFGPNGAIFPGETASVSFLVDTTRGQNQYFSYASMVIPSNDAFVANGDPMAHKIFNDRGRFMPASFIVSGADVLDAGSEVNDEIPANTAALAQMAPDTGEVEEGVVMAHEGFMPEGNILAAIPNGDFTADGYEALQFDVTAKRINSRASAALRGNLEVPAVQTRASGVARLVLEEDGDIDWTLNARRIDGVFAAHIHMGAAGENGGVIVGLSLEGANTDNSRLMATGELTDDDLPEGMTTLDLWQMIQDGETYINVHTEANPSGELRANLP
ncbi:MAG: spondin domain-containing protein [Acidimicrobiales bacterium]